MKRHAGQSGSKGFTLIELLVVIAIIGILAALLFPAINGALVRARAIRVGSNGRQIHMGVFDASVQAEAADQRAVWPRANDSYTTSSDFFVACVTNSWIQGVDLSFFSGPGLEVYTQTREDLESSVPTWGDGNAWCVVEGLGDRSEASTPFLFTRNWSNSDTGLGGGSAIDDISAVTDDEFPFGSRLGIVVTYGGAVKILNDRLATARNFNPGEAGNALMRPE